MCERRSCSIIYCLMGSFSHSILLVLINLCNFGLVFPREESKLHLFSHLFRYPVETYSSTFGFRALVMVEEME